MITLKEVATRAGAVSYTHLDVYKRQVSRSCGSGADQEEHRMVCAEFRRDQHGAGKTHGTMRPGNAGQNHSLKENGQDSVGSKGKGELHD